MLLTTLFFFYLQNANAQSKYDERVNDHLIETSKKIEIESQEQQVKLRRDSPDYLEYDPPRAKKPKPFVTETPKQKKDPEIYRDQYDHPTEYDPAVQVEQDLQQERAIANDEKKSQEEFIRKFKENAEKAGIKVDIDPDTLKVKAHKSSH